MNEFLEKHLKAVQISGKNDFRWSSLRKLVIPEINGTNVLDAGCGTGFLSLLLIQKGYNVWSVDLSEEMIRLTRRTIQDSGYNSNSFQYNLEEDRSLPYHFFDTIICLDVIEHIEDDNNILSYFFELLSPGGVLILSVPAIRQIYSTRDKNMGHYRRYTRYELLLKVASSGLICKKMRYWNILGIAPYIFMKVFPAFSLEERIRHHSNERSVYINSVIERWFSVMENAIIFPIGLTLFAVCRKKK